MHELEKSEMYPECVIASWDGLVFLLDAENIERGVQWKAEKKIECLCKLQTPRNNGVTICKFVLCENNYFYHQTGSSRFILL